MGWSTSERKVEWVSGWVIPHRLLWLLDRAPAGVTTEWSHRQDPCSVTYDTLNTNSLLLFHRLLPQNFSVFRISLEGWIFESPFSWPAVKSLKFLRRFQRQVESWITLCEGAPTKPQKTKTWFSIRKPLAFCRDCHCQVNLNPSFCVWWEQPLFLDILQIVDDNDNVNHWVLNVFSSVSNRH